MRGPRKAAGAPVAVATLPPRGLPQCVQFSMLCGTQHNNEYVAVRIMWRTVRIILLHMRTCCISAT